MFRVYVCKCGCVSVYLCVCVRVWWLSSSSTGERV